MTRAAFHLMLLLVPLCLPVAGAASSQATLEPGDFLHPPPEALSVGDEMTYTWEVVSPAGQDLYFNTHIHIGPKYVDIDVMNATGHEGTLLADREGLHSLYWENLSNQTVEFTYELSVQRESEASATPSIGALLLPALAMAALLTRRQRL